jgi:hypothetical protein
MSMDPLSPPPLNYAVPQPRADLRNAALQQRALNLCILAYIIVGILSFAGILPPLLVGLLALGIIVTGAVFTFMLALSVYGTAAGIILGLLTLIPLLGLIPLLIVNGKATSLLRANGYTVGLLGANPNQVPPTQ